MNEWNMNEEEMIEMPNAIIVLQDEDGNDVEFEFIDQMEYQGGEYVILMPVEDFDGEIVILKVEPTEEEDVDQYVSVDDDDTLQAVFELFKEKFQEQFNFTDGE